MNAREFSISEYLPANSQIEESEDCQCCLCILCQQNHVTTKTHVCVKNHPDSFPCQKNAPLMQKSTVCKTCTESMIMNSKEDASDMFHCIFDSCSVKFKTSSVQQLQSHYLKHLNVSKFMCSICETGFNTKIALRNHERKH